MSEPRRSTRARVREEAAAAPPPETPKETPSKPAKSLKRKRPSVAVAKEPTPGTPVADGAQQPSQPVLPIRVAEGQPLPTLTEPQPLDLSSEEYQDIQHSGVLSASLQRSRAVWVSGTNFRLFHAFFTPPKKVADRTEEDKQNIQRQKEIVRNFPQVGEAQLVIEPHTFPIRLYGPREVVRQVQKKAPTYGQWPNHNQQSPYQYNHPPAPFQSAPQQRPLPPPPKPQPKPQPQNAAPPANQAPAPDPVIHMLAQRAGQDPSLKAVMKIVAAGQATKKQLEFFQGHISELTNILQKQKEAGTQHPQPSPKPAAAQTPQPIVPPPQQQPPKPTPPKQQHIPTPPHAHQPQMAPAPAPAPAPASTPTPTPTPAPAPPLPAAHPNSYNQSYNPQHHYQQNHAQQYPLVHQVPRLTYRPLVFDFKEGNGDKFYFPTYSFMEWLPNNSGAKFSFLVTKMKPKPPSNASMKPPSTPLPKTPQPPASGPVNVPTPTAGPMSVATPGPGQATPAMTPTSTTTPLQPVTPYIPPPRIEDFDEKNDIKEIEFYQPVTVLVMSGHPDILQTLPRAVRPQDVVEKYMNQVFDTCRRAEETFLAFRLPKEGGIEAGTEDKRLKSGDATPVVPKSAADVLLGGISTALDKRKVAGRSRKSIAV
ncbi:hypothetical protein N0V90_008384 [Kalmusia sp. IMI 367209]|nr:hypothetical protein N0V90_008384 [Kalmusia sp. IMI 367209]